MNISRMALILLATIFVATALGVHLIRIEKVVKKEEISDWPQYRRDPANTGYTSTKGPDDNHVLWEFEVDISEVWRSPVVAGNRVFVPEAGRIGKSYLYCLDAQDGELIWKREIKGWNPSTPAVVEGVVYMGGGGDNQIHAFNAENGDEIWSYTLPEDEYASPTVANGKVFFPSLTELYCFNADNGDLIWKTNAGSGIVYSVAFAGNRVYGGSPFYSLSATNGGPLWTLPWQLGSVNYSTPVVANDVVYVTAEYVTADIGIAMAGVFNRLYALDAQTGKILWSYDAVMSGALAVAKNKVLIATLRSKDSYDNAIYDRMPVVTVDNRIVPIGKPGYIHVFLESLDATTGELIWKSDFLGTSTSPSIAVGGDKVYVGTHWGVHALNLENSEIVWSHSDYMLGGLAIANGNLFVGSHTGHVVCFGSA